MIIHTTPTHDRAWAASGPVIPVVSNGSVVITVDPIIIGLLSVTNVTVFSYYAPITVHNSCTSPGVVLECVTVYVGVVAGL